MIATSTPACVHPDKIAHRSRTRATNAAAHHPAVFCRLCMSGCYRWQAYVCPSGHWHCGHARADG